MRRFGLRLLDVPVTAGNDPRARLYVVDHLAPGAVIHRRIQISNSSRADTSIALYPAGATIAQGTFQGAGGHTRNDLSTWTSVTPDGATIAGGGQLMATVTIAVPRDAAPGEQYGVVWAEARSAPDAAGVTEVNRVGIRLYVSVGPGGAPAANFTIESLTAQRSAQGRPLVVASVHNTGGRALDLSGSLDLSAGPGGLSAGPFPATLGVTLAIGDTERVTIALDKRLPAGPWRASVTLHSGLLDRTGQATITFPDTGSSPAVPTSSTGSRRLIFEGVGLLLLMGFAGCAVAARQRRSRRRWSVTRYA
ncbi:MAG: peptidase [Actinomycetota bacterium]|nr:peptidase [Actinomycetota bacterium]